MTRSYLDELEVKTDDERRLLAFFRCVTAAVRDDVLRSLGTMAVERWLPDPSLSQCMPNACGTYPEPMEGRNAYDDWTIGTVFEHIRDGMDATGCPIETLLGSDAYDDERSELFCARALETAERHLSFPNYTPEWALEYIKAWRRSIILALLARAALANEAEKPGMSDFDEESQDLI